MSASFLVALTLAILDLTSTHPIDASAIIVKSNTQRWRRAEKWAKLINKVSKEEKEDPFLVAALVSRESGFDPDKINVVTGALGLMQIMPGSADHYMLGWKRARTSSVPQDKVMVPVTNLKIGIRILKRYRALCEGILVHTVSAYNGLGCVDSEYGRDVERRYLRARSFYQPLG